MVVGVGLVVVPGCNDRSHSNAARPSPSPQPSSIQPPETAPRRADGLPAGVLPVVLARVDAAAQRNVQRADALVFVDLSGALSLGRISHGISPYQALPHDQAATLRSELFAPPAAIRAETGKVLASFGQCGQGFGHVFNLGHGISQFTPPEHAAALVAAVHELSPAYHR